MKRMWNGGIHQEGNTRKPNGSQGPILRYYSILVELTIWYNGKKIQGVGVSVNLILIAKNPFCPFAPPEYLKTLSLLSILF